MTWDEQSSSIEQVYQVANKFPSEWVQQRYNEGFIIDGLSYLGNSWVVVMRKGLGWAQTTRANMSGFALEQWKEDGYYVTDHAEGGGGSITVFSRIPGDVRQSRHFKADWASTPDDDGRRVLRLSFTPFGYNDELFVAVYRAMPQVTAQEVVVRSDPSSFMNKCLAEGMRITKLQRIGPWFNEWFVVGTRMPGAYRQTWFPMDEAKLAEHQRQGFRITCFY